MTQYIHFKYLIKTNKICIHRKHSYKNLHSSFIHTISNNIIFINRRMEREIVIYMKMEHNSAIKKRMK